ncbi:MAG: CRISPR-associated endoribonuclease Cas6 [Thermoplasmata archaeon]|jgi:CRISPR-associated endoribonuclease Cas6
MRIFLKLKSLESAAENSISKYTIQGMLYSSLINSKFYKLHDQKGFKFFTFSDLFPSGDFKKGEFKNLIISSPNDELIGSWYDYFRSNKYIYLSNLPMEITDVRKFEIEPSQNYESGSPIVLFKNKYENTYLSFKRGDNLQYFLYRLKDNALKKFNAYYEDQYYFEGPIFDRLILKKEIVIPNRIKISNAEHGSRNQSLIVGTVWSELGRDYIERDERKFYKFIMDCGLGEKNSLGFGFINPKLR